MAGTLTSYRAAPLQRIAPGEAGVARTLDRVLLAALLVAAPLIYLPLVTHNLPVASGLDEGNALEVLRRFHHGSLNPQFFEYPTLYFYVVYALLLPLRYSNVHALLAGRLFDLVLIGVIAWIVYAFCRDRLSSRAAGCIGAAFALCSPILSDMVYLHPDLLMTATGTAAVYFLVDYFDRRSRRSWALGVVLMGVSIGCKYTALILYFAYAATEAVTSLRDRHLPVVDRNDGGRLSRNVCVGLLVASGILLLLTACFLPVHALLVKLLALRANYQAGPGDFYVKVFGHLRRAMAELGFFSMTLAALCRRSRDVYESLAIKRLYKALGIILLLSVLCTPYCMIHPLQVVFDLGALTRSNIAVAGGHAQWGTYLRWLVYTEGFLPVIAGVMGIGLFVAQAPRRFCFIAIYLAMYLYVLGSSQRGYPRYLAPALPLLYCGVGFIVDRLWNSTAGGSSGRFMQRWQRPLAALTIAGVAVPGVLRVASVRRQARATNSFFASYTATKQTKGTVYYAGYAPSIELQEAGVKTQELDISSLVKAPLGQRLSCADSLILDTPQATYYNIQATHDRSVTVLVDAPGSGQEAQQVLRASGCQ